MPANARPSMSAKPQTPPANPPALTDSDFALFALAEQFAVQEADLTRRWKQLQQQMHPDRFARQGAAAQRMAVQWSGRINEAYQRLKNPLQRAAYLCELWGSPVAAENSTTMPADFLMQQMEWREALDEAQSTAALDALLSEVTALEQILHTTCASSLTDREHAVLDEAVQAVRKWMFVQKFRHAIRRQYAHCQ